MRAAQGDAAHVGGTGEDGGQNYSWQAAARLCDLNTGQGTERCNRVFRVSRVHTPHRASRLQACKQDFWPAIHSAWMASTPFTFAALR